MAGRNYVSEARLMQLKGVCAPGARIPKCHDFDEHKLAVYYARNRSCIEKLAPKGS